MSGTTRTTCPKCSRDDCFFTREDIGVLINSSIRKITTVCNACGYMKSVLVVGVTTVVTEVKEPEYEETELQYPFHGREQG